MIFRGNGKLLLSGEYVILSGAKGLAVPIRPGQSLEVLEGESPNQLVWQSFLEDGTPWFQAKYAVEDWCVLECSDLEIARRLQSLFQLISGLKPDFAEKAGNKNLKARLEFPREWGFGSSSSLIYVLSKWSEADPFYLLDNSFGGSGYDLIAAGEEQPFLFWREPTPHFESVELNWPFLDELFLVYLGKKQNSREGIRRYQQRQKLLKNELEQITNLSLQLLQIKNLSEFEQIINAHESILAQLLNLPKAKDLYFSDYPGVVKSLGAWGGDFVLVSSGGLSAKAVTSYFQRRGFNTVFPFSDILFD